MADLKHPLFADEQYPIQIVNALRALGYDVETVQQHQGTSRPASGLSDDQVLAIAVQKRRAVLTLNIKHIRALHSQRPNHRGIIACKDTRDYDKRAKEIDAMIKANVPLHGKLIHVPAKPETE
jgi:hypothetical protein